MKRLYFTPDKLMDCQKIWHLYADKKFEFAETIEDADVVFNWSVKNVITPVLNIPNKRVVNGYCIDVSKANVERIFSATHKRSTLAESGLAIEKNSYLQGQKDAKLVNLDSYIKKPDCIYQRPMYINNVISESRYSIMNGNVVLRYDRRIILPDLKEGDLVKGEITDRNYTLCNNVSKEFISFIRAIGLDYGEVEVLRYQGQEWIIDVNNIPGDAIFFYDIENKEWITAVWKYLFTENYLI